MEEKKLSEFLKENDAYESFIDNCLNDRDTLLYVVDYNLSNTGIFSGFTWAETSEGDDYWSKLFDKSRKLDLNYDMDEILYKEYERRNMKESSEQNPITKDIVETGEENTKQEFQIITLNGIEYNLVPKEISVGYIANFYDKDMKAETTEEYLRKLDRLEVLKQKHREGDYVFIVRDCMVKGNWKNFDSSDFKKDSHYKYFHISHEEILQRFLRDNTLKIQYRWHDEDWMLLDDFIENYDENMQLKIAKKEFEPFTLIIEVKTLDEAKSLWNRFNLNYNTLCRALCNSYNIEFENRISTHKYWTQIDDILKDFGEVPDVKP